MPPHQLDFDLVADDENPLSKKMTEITSAIAEQSVKIDVLIETVSSHSEVIKPLSDHTVELVEVARAWRKTKEVGRTAQHLAFVVRFLRQTIIYTGSLAIAIAAIWALTNGKFLAILGNQP